MTAFTVELIALGLVLAVGKWLAAAYYIITGIKLRKSQKTMNEIFDELEEK